MTLPPFFSVNAISQRYRFAHLDGSQTAPEFLMRFFGATVTKRWQDLASGFQNPIEREFRLPSEALPNDLRRGSL
jgi:hypothetical protein